MTATTSRRDLEGRLRDTLRAKADQLPGDSFAGLEGPVLAVVVDAPTRRRSVGLRHAVAIAATVTMLVVAAGVTWSLRSDAPAPTPRVAPGVVPRAVGSVEHPATGTILAPAQAPIGLRLWSMQTMPHQGTGSSFVTEQLFGHLSADGAPNPGILIETTPTTPSSELFPGWTNLTTIHGQRAPIHDSKDAGEAPTEIDWMEDGTLVRATIRGLDPLEAASILDRMRPRATGLLTGLDPATAPTELPLLGEHTNAAEEARTTDAFFAYGTDAPSPGRPVELWVRTSTTYAYPSYLREWIAGTGNTAGSTHLDPDDGLYLSKPDGSTIVVGPASVPREQLERVAETVVALDDSQARAMQASVDTRLAALPLLGRRDVDGVTLELRGDDVPTTLCLATPISTPVCAPPVSQDSPATTVPDWIVASVLIDGRWYVAAAAARQPWFGASERPTVPSEIADQSKAPLGNWYSTALLVPDDLTAVFVSADDPNQIARALTIFNPSP